MSTAEIIAIVFAVVFVAVMVAYRFWPARVTAIARAATEPTPAPIVARNPGREWVDYLEQKAKDQFADDLTRSIAIAQAEALLAAHRAAVAPPVARHPPQPASDPNGGSAAG